MKKISVSLLVYNEKHNLEKTIAKAYKTLEQSSYNYELWVFDNNSNDGTDLLVQSLLKQFDNLKYFRQKENLGYAGNFHSALKVPIADYKCVIDGDGQYDIGNIVECIQTLDQGYDILIGIRKPRRDPRIRIFMSLILKYLSKIILGSHLDDINAGFRCMTEKAAKQIDIKYRYNFVNPEIFSLSVIKKLKICEKIIKHNSREGGRSELSGIKNLTLNSVKMIKYMIDLRNEIKRFHKN